MLALVLPTTRILTTALPCCEAMRVKSGSVTVAMGHRRPLARLDGRRGGTATAAALGAAGVVVVDGDGPDRAADHARGTQRQRQAFCGDGSNGTLIRMTCS